jgi:hypothetical protein
MISNIQKSQANQQ